MGDLTASQRSPHPTCTAGRQTTLIAIGLFVLTILTYLPALDNQFVNWDDTGYVTKNDHVAAGLTWPGIYYAWTTFDVGNWIPLTWLSYELDATLFGIDPAAFHAVNVLLHAINTLLLFIVLVRMTGSTWRSATVAALFAVHPLHVESVAWVSERKDVISTCALLCVLLFYERYAAHPSRPRMLAVCTAFALGLLAKSMLVTVPALLLLIDFWPLQRWPGNRQSTLTTDNVRTYSVRTLWQLISEKWPLFALSLADCLITIFAQWNSAVIALQSETLVGRVMNSFDAYRWYLLKTFVPLRLTAFYPHPGTVDLDWLEHSWKRLVCSMVIMLTITAVVIWRRTPVVFFGWFWFVVSMLPVIGLIQVGSQAYADRYTYIPHIGLFVTIVWGTHALLWGTSQGRWLGTFIVITSLAACVALTRAQVATWKTTESLWQHAVAVDPENLFAQLRLGVELHEQRRLDDAKTHFSAALKLFPALDAAIYYLGDLHEIQGNEPLAIAYFEWLLRLRPNDHAARQALSRLYRKRPPGNRPQTSPQARREVELGVGQGTRMTRQRNWERALMHFERAIAIDPNCESALRLAGDALEELGRIDESKERFEAAIRLNPLDVEARHAIDRLDWKKTKLE